MKAKMFEELLESARWSCHDAHRGEVTSRVKKFLISEENQHHFVSMRGI